MNCRDARSISKSGNKAPLLILISIGVVCLILGLTLGWLLFGRTAGEPAAATPLPAAAQPTAAATSVLSPTIVIQAAPADDLHPPDLAGLQVLALDLVNQNRTAIGLAPVQWDATAARLAQTHAEDMLRGRYFSHWNRDGYGPDHRAALLAGSGDAVFENIHAFGVRFDDGSPAPIANWPQRVQEAHEGWMQSPGHRDNILEPAHTHVGIGIAYRAEIGELRMVQEFVNRYVELEPIPPDLPVLAEWPLKGRLLAGATDPIVNLAYEPFPQPLTAEELANTGVYASAAANFAAPAVELESDRLRSRLLFSYDDRPGLYHIRIFVTVQGRQILAASPIIAVR